MESRRNRYKTGRWLLFCQYGGGGGGGEARLAQWISARLPRLNPTPGSIPVLAVVSCGLSLLLVLSLLRGFFSGFSGFPPSTKTHISKYQFGLDVERLNTNHWLGSMGDHSPRVSTFNPLRPNSDLSQTSHCNIKGVSVSQVMRIENMIPQVQFY